ncbi:hypothetical protein Smp_153180 [Schistosoma mansoni]|uniref:hypothetical protein n=1 Tax=Schistosoma mansoni TaxID=6183 RepID=UPI0001A637E8|nr:hypothetical protein Smp_153180 [Schistosoma mansoni]|eukprot:XP_018653792.1 hypothetical protein Smp_153180 [Schistosoma mansoni]
MNRTLEFRSSDAPVPKTRRLSLRSKRSFDCSFELWDENYFSVERKISQLEGVHYAAFNINKVKRENSPELVNLIEDQQVTCLDADNPDNWVVRIHPVLQHVNSLHKQIKKDNTQSDSQIIDETDYMNDLVEVSVSNSQELSRACEEIKKIGRVKAVYLTRNLKSAQRGKRNPRESFREDVISFSNKQQESRMKLRYTLTELCDTELEYSRALRQLSDILDSLNGKIILNMFLEKLPLYSSDPGKSAECFTKTTDIKIGQHKNIQLDQNEMKMERLILLPDHLLSLKNVNEDNSVYCWKLDELRVGEYGNDGNDETSFELWNISGEAPIKLIFRITCPNIISRNAWVEDIRYAIKEKQSANISKSIVESHIEAYWNSKKRFSGIMELSPCPSESINEMYFDAIENIQQINTQNIHTTQLSHIDKCEVIKTSFNQKSTSSSSYYTAEEPIDENEKDQAPSTNLFESYSTLDGVQTPFSEDQQSLADFQMSPENRGNQTQQLTTTSTNLTGTDTCAKQLTVNAGEQIQFNASFTITGPVAYETTWYMNGAPMKPDIGAEMILSDRDTRLLISNADPLIHSGTYSCRCRLFEGTETAVYFCVNILTAKLDQNNTNDNESDQLKLTNFMQTNVFNPITKELDLPIGKLLEIQVKIDEETVWKLMNNSKENIQVNWYQNSTLIEPSSTCEMLKINDRFILRSTTNHLQPDKLYNYTCILRLPENSSMSPAPSITIPVSFHCPTVKELETEFKNCIDKNKVTVENNPVFEVELEEDDAFQLKIPIQNGSQNQDFVVWWTHEDELLTVYKC